MSAAEQSSHRYEVRAWGPTTPSGRGVAVAYFLDGERELAVELVDSLTDHRCRNRRAEVWDGREERVVYRSEREGFGSWARVSAGFVLSVRDSLRPRGRCSALAEQG